MYITCFNIEKLRWWEKNQIQRKKYYRLNYWYFDFNDKIIKKVSISIDILKFCGCVRINTLKIFSLSYHFSSNHIRAEFINCGRRVLFLRDMYHRHYYDNTFFMNKNQTVKVSVNSRMMIDATFFREMNSNYTRSKMNGSSSIINCIDFFSCSSTSIKNTKKMRYVDLKSNELKLTDLFFYYLIVSGFNFNFTDKL